MPLPSIDADAVTMHSLVSNAETQTYQVPPFQRSYAWDKDEFGDFYDDIVDQLDGTTDVLHFMGAMVFLSRDGQPWWVLDGQQRFSTLLLFLAAARDALKSSGVRRGVNTDVSAGKIDDLISLEIPGSYPVERRARLELNRTDDALFSRILRSLEIPGRATPDMQKSERLILKAYRFFLEKFTEELQDEVRWRELDAFRAAIVSALAHRVSYIRVQIRDEANAQAVFEALNNRGVDLTQADLIKNYLFMEVQGQPTALHEAEVIWQSLVSTIGEQDLAMFLRYQWNSAHGFVRMDDLYRDVRRKISQGNANVLTYLQELDREAKLFALMRHPSVAGWVDESTRKALTALKTLGLRTSYVLLLAGLSMSSLTDPERRQYVKGILCFSVRYFTVGGEPANRLEKDFSDWAIHMRTGDLDPTGVLTKLRALASNERQFLKDFEYLSVRDTNVAKYLLREINREMLRREGRPVEFEETLELEHIIPQTMTAEWNQDLRLADPNAVAEALVDRFGNLTLLEKRFNIAGSNKRLAAKRERAYDVSGLPSNSDLSTHANEPFTVFGPAEILVRERGMAPIAESIWRV